MYFREDQPLTKKQRRKKKKEKMKVGQSTDPKSLARTNHDCQQDLDASIAPNFSAAKSEDNWLYFAKIVAASSRRELRLLREILQKQSPNCQYYKWLLKSKICDGDEAVCLKASCAAIAGNLAYDASVVADHNGCDISRWLKFVRDRTLQENIRFSNFKGAMRFLDLGNFECLEDSTPRLTIAAGICKTVESFARKGWPQGEFPTLRNGILPLQSGLLITTILRSPLLDEFLAVDWQEPKAAQRIVNGVGVFSDHLHEIIVRVNLDIQEIPRLPETIDLVDEDNVSKFLAFGIPFAWQWFLLSEMVPSEWMEEARRSQVGVYDEFWRFDQNYRDVFYSTSETAKK